MIFRGAGFASQVAVSSSCPACSPHRRKGIGSEKVQSERKPCISLLERNANRPVLPRSRSPHWRRCRSPSRIRRSSSNSIPPDDYQDGSRWLGIVDEQSSCRHAGRPRIVIAQKASSIGAESTRFDICFGNSFQRQIVEPFSPVFILDYLIFDFGQRSQQISASKSNLLAANFQFNDTHRKVIFQ